MNATLLIYSMIIPVMKTLKIEGHICQIHRKAIKNLYIRILSDGVLKISAPIKIADTDIINFVCKNKQWIAKHMHKSNSLLFDSSLTYHAMLMKKIAVNGRLYYVKEVSSHGRPEVILGYDTLMLKVNQKQTCECKLKVVRTWLKQQLTTQMLALVPKYEQIMSVKVEQLKVRQMRTLWGSCNPTKKRVWLNAELITKAVKLQEYILVHEMVHLLETCHNNRFRCLMDRFFPCWRSCDQALKEN